MTHRFLLGNLAALLLPTLSSFAAQPDFNQLNAAFGIPVWADDHLWENADSAVADRLKWPAESRTTDDSSYRLYAGSKSRVLGARPYSLALYGRDGKADRISMVFANKGDVAKLDPITHRLSGDYKKEILSDTKTIGDSLTSLLGPAKIAQFGQGMKTREQVARWDWNGHSILLAAPRGEYVAVRIVPTSVADGESAAHVSNLALQDKLRTRIERRPNGDVILQDLPMVDQGPKGYCVPATWERAMRYMGIPADMYVLAMASQSDAGGGASVESMIAGANEVISRYGRHLLSTGGRLSTQMVSRYIDAGLPILWPMFAEEDVEQNVTNRSAQRRAVTDWASYKAMLAPWRQNARHIRTSVSDAHMCMIIGYNSQTSEIAISDSWGPGFGERWITVEEANAISQGQFTVIEP